MWQSVRISYRQPLGSGNISRDITARLHVYRLRLDVSLLGCKWHSSRDVYKAARRLLDEHDIVRYESLRVEGPHWALYDFLKFFKRHNSKAKKSAGIKWLHIIEDLSDVEMLVPSKPFQLDLIAAHLTCLNAQFAGASQFPPEMDRVIFEDHLFSREIYWDGFFISGAKRIVLSNVGIPGAWFPYHLGILPAHLPGHVCAKAKYLARASSTLISIAFHALQDYEGGTITVGDSTVYAAEQLFEEIFLKHVAANLEEVHFVDITQYTWAGFITACKQIQFDFPMVHTLRLENVNIRSGGDDFGLLARVFPKLTQLTVKGMSYSHGENVIRLLSGDGFVWPEMREIEYDGVVVDREAGMESRSWRTIPPNTLSVEL